MCPCSFSWHIYPARVDASQIEAATTREPRKSMNTNCVMQVNSSRDARKSHPGTSSTLLKSVFCRQLWIKMSRRGWKQHAVGRHPKIRYDIEQIAKGSRGITWASRCRILWRNRWHGRDRSVRWEGRAEDNLEGTSGIKFETKLPVQFYMHTL